MVGEKAVGDNLGEGVRREDHALADPKGAALAHHPLAVQRDVLALREEPQVRGEVLLGHQLVVRQGREAEPLVGGELGGVLGAGGGDCNFSHSHGQS